MGESAFRKLVSCVLLFLFPMSLLAADSNAAMLYTNGGAWVNGSHVPRASSAIFSGDLVQTPADSVANINEAGSAITVLTESLVQFQGSSVKIEHGGVTVSTSKGLATLAGDWKVTPASLSWTEFNVSDINGTVLIAATKGNLLISDGQQTTTLEQGQQTTRDESSGDTDKNGKKKEHAGGAAPAAGGGILNAPIVVGIGIGAIAAITILVLAKNDRPASPSKPK